MKISHDLAPDAIRKILRSEITSGRGSLDARTLYQLWQSTGLRRQDLAHGIMAMSEAHELFSHVRDGKCYLAVPHRPRKRGAPRTSHLQVEERAQALTKAAARIQGASRHYAYRRSTDLTHPQGRHSERRLGESGRLIAALPLPERDLLLGQAELVPVTTGNVLWQVGERIHYAYLPINCILSNRIELEDGHFNEIFVTGNEGIAGLEVCQGKDHASYRVEVEQGGFAHRLPALTLKREFERGEALQALLLQYSHAQLMQVALGSTCNHYHSVESRLCRVLLLIADRVRSNILLMTHDELAGSVGVRREAITDALGQLHAAGLIRRARKHISLLDRGALETRACECYAAIRAGFDSLRQDSPIPSRATLRLEEHLAGRRAHRSSSQRPLDGRH